RFNINIKNGRGETALSWAVRCDDAIVQLLLDAFPDVDTHQVDNEGRSPLSYAVSHLDSKTIKLLLDHCPESDVQHLNRPDNQGCTVVSYASRKMGDDILRLFLGKFPQIDVDTPDKDGWTPLRWALEGYYKGSALPSWDCMKVLLATRRVNPFHADFRGKSPFVRAQQRIYERKIKL
ncbi:ankyrin repeat-containing domain protein, partial [Copromyces sp. CBS 386.78]